MNELMQRYIEKLLNYWQQLEKGQKLKIIAIIIFLVASLVLFTVLTTRTKYELTFVNLDQKTAGNIIQKLDEMSIPYQLTAGGSNISVPEAQSSKVKVLMAQEDLGSGNIYSKFWDNASFGMTDSQFKVLERSAIEEELKGLIREIQGISNAYVMITIPDNKVFWTEDEQNATASVVVNIEPGVKLSVNQIKSIYNLISRSVPKLPVENIILADQYGDPLEYNSQNQNGYNQQRQIQLDFQQDIKKEIERMLGMIMGPNRVSVTVFAKMNFDQKTTIENLKVPVVDGKGIARSVETIQESFTGDGNSQGGIVGTGPSQIPGYEAGTSNNGSYEHLEERINYDVNEITKEVISSPYSLEDLSINIVIDLSEDNDPNSVTGQTKQAIRELVEPIVLAAIGDKVTDIDQKIAVVAHKFEERTPIFENNQGLDPLYLYGAIGLSVLALGGISYSIASRNRKRRETIGEAMAASESKVHEFDFTPVLTEEAALQQEIQKLSKHKPNEFVKLVRTWLSEE